VGDFGGAIETMGPLGYSVRDELLKRIGTSSWLIGSSERVVDGLGRVRERSFQPRVVRVSRERAAQLLAQLLK
jgi:hypothetical protein